MDTLVGRVVRLEPLATRHTPDLFAALGNDEEAKLLLLTEAFKVQARLVEALG